MPLYGPVGFHNQIKGRIKSGEERYPATGTANVIVVDPDPDAAGRIAAVAGPNVNCDWRAGTVEEWVNNGS